MRLWNVNNLPMHRTLDETHDFDENALAYQKKFDQKNYWKPNKHDRQRNNEGQWEDDECW